MSNELDKYQKECEMFLVKYAENQNLLLQSALRDVLGDFRIMAEFHGLDFQKALDGFDKP